jgi:SSS family transporter
MCPFTGAFLTGPLFARLGLVSVFEYLERRFRSTLLRHMGTLCYLVNTFIGTAIFIYGPAVSLRAYTDYLSDTWSIVLVGSIATFYTSIGGIKAVIWTDLFQLCVMLLSLLILIVAGVYDLENGLYDVFSISSRGGRLNMLNFNPDPFERQNFWSLLIGFYCIFVPYYAADQQMLQRFLASKTKRLAQRALVLNAPGGFLIISLCSLLGLIIYATYSKCDPLSAGQISNPNHLVIFFIKDKLEHFKGASGLFLSAVFCGSLSSVSSTLNSMSAIVYHDFVNHQKSSVKLCRNELTSLKLIVIILGVLSSAFAMVIATFGSNLSQISTSLKGAFTSPILGLFILGWFFTVTNKMGAVCGTVCGFAFGVFISLGAYFTKPAYLNTKLAVSVEACALNLSDTSRGLPENAVKPGFEKIFYLSYMWYTTAGGLITVIVALVVSVVTNHFCFGSRGRLNRTVHSSSELLLFDVCWCFYRKQKSVSESRKQIDLVECSRSTRAIDTQMDF